MLIFEAIFPSASKKSFGQGEGNSEMEQHKFVDILTKFAERVTLKLREMNITKPVNPGSSMPKRLFNELLNHLQWLKELKADIAVADNLNIREDMRDAAKSVAQRTFKGAEESAVASMVEILSHCSWEMADVLAKALVKEMTTTEKAKKAIQRAENGGKSRRFRVHLVPAFQIRAGQLELANEYAGKITNSFADKVQVEDWGWQEAGDDEACAPTDGIFIVLTVQDRTVAVEVKNFVRSICAGQVSVVELISAGPESQPE